MTVAVVSDTDASLPEHAARDDEGTCTAVAEGLADMEAGRSFSFEDARAAWATHKAVRQHGPSAPV